MTKKAEKKSPKKKLAVKKKGKGLLTLKEQKIKKALLEGKSKKAACIAGGYAESTAESKRTEIVAAVVAKIGGIQALMDEMGLDDKCLLGTLKEGLEANKVISAMVVRGKPDSTADEQDGMADAHSMTKDFVEVPDHMARHKFMDSGLKLRGHLRDKLDIEHTIETYEQKRRRLLGE